MPTIDVRDTNLYYETAGTGDTTLLFIHGMCGGAWNWEDQMNRLSPEFHCVAYARRGHSGSEPGIGDQNYSTHVDDVAALIDRLDLNQPIVVGSSSGGSVAIELLQRYPEHVEAAVVSEPALYTLDPAAGEKLMAELEPAVQSAVATGGPRAAVDTFFGAVASSFWEQADERTRDRLRDNAPMLFATLESELPAITPDDLTGINQPALVLAGEKSLPYARSIARTIAERLPDARFIEFEDCGHMTYLEQPAEFARAVTDFAHEIAGPGSTSQ